MFRYKLQEHQYHPDFDHQSINLRDHFTRPDRFKRKSPRIYCAGFKFGFSRFRYQSFSVLLGRKFIKRLTLPLSLPLRSNHNPT